MIAILDDDALSAEALSFLLNDWGFNTIVAQSGQDEAVNRLAAANGIRMVIADYHLRGGRNGITEAAGIAERHGRMLPTLIMSGSLGEKSFDAATNRGFAYLPKPVDPDELQRVLESMVVKPERPFSTN